MTCFVYYIDISACLTFDMNEICSNSLSAQNVTNISSIKTSEKSHSGRLISQLRQHHRDVNALPAGGSDGISGTEPATRPKFRNDKLLIDSGI
ncbi:hypothetical protein SDC9_135484 [bioreactor metagenome]|uniref:Uncharacterized protein n=1 Tax=bioreactor metagenome TaxID=1076179 RepID=A0A645DGJ8_9ZZZZ